MEPFKAEFLKFMVYRLPVVHEKISGGLPPSSKIMVFYLCNKRHVNALYYFSFKSHGGVTA
jgi:hypothetical protein